jgi:aldose 1-epimerase
MASSLTLSSPHVRCDIVPALGGCVAGLWFHGMPVLRSTPPAQLSRARLAASYPLVPFSNRVAHARLQWQGISHALVKNNGEEPHAIHGVGWERPWTVLEQAPDFARLTYAHRPDASWPFAFDATQTIQVGLDSVTLTLGMTNQSAHAAPAGLGWHPYFTKRADAHVRFIAEGRWDMGPDKLPTQRQPSAGLDAACADLDLDHCFDGWDGSVELADAVMVTRIQSTLGHLVVYTQPSREFVAIEPVSHVNNALELATQTGVAPERLGLRVLQPGETMVAQMTLQMKRVTE